jgi:hypothetical protein
VIVKTKATSVIGTPNSWEIGTMINKKIVKSNASRVQPSHAGKSGSQWTRCSREMDSNPRSPVRRQRFRPFEE